MKPNNKDNPKTLTETIIQLIPSKEGREEAERMRKKLLGLEEKVKDPCLHKVLTIKYSGSQYSLSYPDCVPCSGSPDSCKNYVSYYSVTGRKYDDIL